ncbi:MAG: bacillithiol biosynthesis cysteine-adding enzyme BshC [Acidobacteriales bacterium]|nr:bacillithiol biosynthesis cysteine-adding enzyme BshC [Terriglobales bacterium]
MRRAAVPFETIPHTSRLFRDFLGDQSQVKAFLPHPPFFRDWISTGHGKVRHSSQERVTRVVDVLARQNRAWGAGDATLKNLERLREGAAAIVTGQQVVLFGGQLMAFLKALTAIKIAAEATSAGVATVPIFWLATEDHDLAEVAGVRLYGCGWELRTLTASPAAASGKQVGGIPFGDEVRAALAEAATVLGESEVTDLLRQSYVPGATMGDAYARFFAKVFAEYGLILIDNSDPELHRIAQPIFSAAVERSEELNAALLARDKELEDAGYHAQVKVEKNSTLLFAQQQGTRTVLHRSRDGFTLGEENVSRAALLARANERPEDFSANALLRPIVQDYLLPTLAYVGGPAEVAYFAQSAVLYKKLLGRVTPVLPRATATIVEPRIAALMQKFGLGLEDAFVPVADFRRRVGVRALPDGLREELEGARCTVGDMEGPIRHELQQLDPTLEAAAAKAFAKIRHQVERLERKAATALLRRNAELDVQARKLSNALYPHQNLQEREIAGAHFLGRFGLRFLRRLHDAIRIGSPDHQVLYPEG